MPKTPDTVKTILAIDDQPSVLQSLGWLLESRGYRVLTAVSASQAEEVFASDDIDVVIVDHGLEGIDGVELARRLKAVRAVPVIMLSGNPELKPPPEAVEIFLAKPQDPARLLAAVEQLVGPANS